MNSLQICDRIRRVRALTNTGGVDRRGPTAGDSCSQTSSTENQKVTLPIFSVFVSLNTDVSRAPRSSALYSGDTSPRVTGDAKGWRFPSLRRLTRNTKATVSDVVRFVTVFLLLLRIHSGRVTRARWLTSKSKTRPASKQKEQEENRNTVERHILPVLL